MLRLIAYLIAIALAATGLSWLADRPGSLVVNWQGYEIETSVFRAIVIFALVVALSILVWSAISYVWSSPASLGRFLNRRRADHRPIDLNVIPLIDVVFFLLIFYVISTAFVQETAVTLQRPVSSAASPVGDGFVPVAIVKSGAIQVGPQVVDLAGVRDARSGKRTQAKRPTHAENLRPQRRQARAAWAGRQRSAANYVRATNWRRAAARGGRRSHAGAHSDCHRLPVVLLLL